MSNKKPKDWWWGYFDTHPDFEKKLPVAYANEKERQPKVMCGACKIKKMIDEQQKDCEEQHQGLQNNVRTHDQIITYLWSQSESLIKDRNCPWIRGRPDTIVPHLNSCDNQPPEVCAQARAVCIEKGWIKAPRLAHEVISLNSSQLPGISPSHKSPAYFQQLLQSPSLLVGLFDVPAMGSSNPSSRSQSPLLSFPPTSSRTSSPAFGEGSQPAPSKQVWQISQSWNHMIDTPTTARGTPSWLHWTPAFQERLETHIANITASYGFSLNWIENQAVCSFMNEFFPFVNPISSYQLSNHIIPHEVERYQQAAKNHCRGSDATLQTDGWTGVNFRYLLAFMITTAS
ncbi:hypothetical protein F4604DRAFT_1931909 [Suillus subluteus]|nr:hypothetical protein F4604DRAFT_1931909 [Suillus subluteus]